jgi:hypothetical protein
MGEYFRRLVVFQLMRSYNIESRNTKNKQIGETPTSKSWRKSGLVQCVPNFLSHLEPFWPNKKDFSNQWNAYIKNSTQNTFILVCKVKG